MNAIKSNENTYYRPDTTKSNNRIIAETSRRFTSHFSSRLGSEHMPLAMLPYCICLIPLLLLLTHCV